jgi:hypothetical protein
LFVAGAAAGYVTFAARPSVYVDNAKKAPVQIWIDGKKSIVAEPTQGAAARPTIDVGYGNHKFGWSAVDATAPTGEVEGAVKWWGYHLYSPGGAGCYRIDVSLYGDATSSDIHDGSLPRSDFYTLPHVDNWFHENERTVSTKSSGARRVALLPDLVCIDPSNLNPFRH